ncbi:LuxR C-terminal-related transcriptional regulator [Streptomyces griseorubiginosus]|uniref:LuxR C-terminal-related transcriptional regulator n=1 Tax=Streptomyces griseorubiginosus TaxID=67304 RepID=UPI0036E21B11
MSSLTRRQREVLTLAANGKTNTQIGEALGITRNTADRHLAGVYEALGVRDRAQAVAVALAVGELGVQEIYVPEKARELT